MRASKLKQCKHTNLGQRWGRKTTNQVAHFQNNSKISKCARSKRFSAQESAETLNFGIIMVSANWSAIEAPAVEEYGRN